MAGDGLPSKICRQCIRQLDRWYAFKQKCENSDAALRQFAQKPKAELVCVKVRITGKLIIIANNNFAKLFRIMIAKVCRNSDLEVLIHGPGYSKHCQSLRRFFSSHGWLMPILVFT